MTLQNLRAALDKLTKSRDEAAIALEAVEGPRRRFAQAEADRQAAAEAIAQAEAQIEQWKSERLNCVARITRREKREAAFKAVIPHLDSLADDVMGGVPSNVEPQTLARAAFQLRAELEALANDRAEEKRLTDALRKLGA